MTRLKGVYLGEDVPITITYTDPDTDDPIDPDDTDADSTADATITIESDGMTVIDDVAMTNQDVGQFEYVWDTATDIDGEGVYTITISAEFSSETKIEKSALSVQ